MLIVFSIIAEAKPEQYPIFPKKVLDTLWMCINKYFLFIHIQHHILDKKYVYFSSSWENDALKVCEYWTECQMAFLAHVGNVWTLYSFYCMSSVLINLVFVKIKYYEIWCNKCKFTWENTSQNESELIYYKSRFSVVTI